ncbi:MAG: 30S ribosomal protein S16 [Halorhodospira sp.]
MVTIRLARAGAKKRPFYHIVVTEAKKPRDGAFIERLGYFNPVAAGQEVPLKLDVERSRAWIAKGAQPTERVEQLIKQAERAEQAAQ